MILLDKVNQENDLLEKQEIVDSINMYLKSQDPALSQNIDIRHIKGIDNLLNNKDLVNNHEKLTTFFKNIKKNKKLIM